MVGSAGLALVIDTVPKAKIGKAMGMITISTGLATVLAPVLGGLAYAKSGYDSVFVMAFAFIGLDLILRVIMIEKRDALRWSVPQESTIERDTECKQDCQDKVSSMPSMLTQSRWKLELKKPLEIHKFQNSQSQQRFQHFSSSLLLRFSQHYGASSSSQLS